MRISIVEGFDRVGKTRVIKDLCNLYRDYDKVVSYKPPYTGLELKFNKTVSGWVLGYCFLDSLIQTDLVDANYHVIMDRHIASSWVYNRLYGSGDGVDDKVVQEDLRLLSMFRDVEHFYVTHSNMGSALNIYKATSGKETHKDVLDQFEGFNSYWEKFLEADALFKLFYDKFDIPCSIMKSVSNSDGYILEYI